MIIWWSTILHFGGIIGGCIAASLLYLGVRCCAVLGVPIQIKKHMHGGNLRQAASPARHFVSLVSLLSSLVSKQLKALKLSLC